MKIRELPDDCLLALLDEALEELKNRIPLSKNDWQELENEKS